MRIAEIFYKDKLAGILKESDLGEYSFVYQAEYIKEHSNDFICFSMPVNDNIYTSDRLFPFFEGLIPEGWLLNIATKNWKIDNSDRMGLLLACCNNCIGAVSVKPLKIKDEK
ncbi:MAG: HipA N-terminal domain-containing protein [Flavobacteriaceae bacterium]|nr:HipA N-terminal domain-containing protein [Flavobacteriaceae bacterium]